MSVQISRKKHNSCVLQALLNVSLICTLRKLNYEHVDVLFDNVTMWRDPTADCDWYAPPSVVSRNAGCDLTLMSAT